LHAVPRRFTLRCSPAVFHPSARRRCGHRVVDRFIQANVRRCGQTAVDRFIQANALPRLGCVRHHPLRTGRPFIRVEVRLRAPVHTPWQLSRKAIESRHSPIAEIQLSHACGTSETPERSSRMETIYETRTICGMETICGTQTISEMETIRGTQTICGMERTICVVTGKNTFSVNAQGIGIATGIATATIGGMATDAPSLMERG
jgi:hypothetical protein